MATNYVPATGILGLMHDRVSKLIHDLYALDAHPEQMRKVLQRIADYSRTHAASVASGTREAKLSLFCSATDPDLLTEFSSRWAPHDPTIPVMMRSRVNQTLSLEDVGGLARFQKTSVGQSFWPKTGHSPVHLRMKLHQDANSWMVFALNARIRDNEIMPETAAAFALFAPHVQRASDIQRRLRDAFFDRSVSKFPDGQAAAILVDRDRRVLFHDDTAERLFGTSRIVMVRGGRIALAPMAANDRLQQLIAGCFDYDVGRAVPGGHLEITQGAGLRIDAIPASAATVPIGLELAAFKSSAVLLVIEDREAAEDALTQALRAKFGLTQAEATIAVASRSVLGRTDLAHRFGLSEHTVKTHLTRIYEKTGTTRRMQLAQLVESFAKARHR